MFNFSTISLWEIRKSSQISPLTFCLFKSWAAQTVDWPSCTRVVIQVQISATFPYLFNCIYINSICTTERQLIASKFQWEFHFCASRTRQQLSFMCPDTAENESSILNWVLCKPLCLPSHTKWQTETQGTMNKAGQVLLQHHTACLRYLHRGIAPNALHIFGTISLAKYQVISCLQLPFPPPK
jgi:hypothetical protein